MYYYTKTSLRVAPHLELIYGSWDPRLAGSPVNSLFQLYNSTQISEGAQPAHTVTLNKASQAIILGGYS
jgi:hypothetical protein